jgi:hypothetical protein
MVGKKEIGLTETPLYYCKISLYPDSLHSPARHPDYRAFPENTQQRLMNE